MDFHLIKKNFSAYHDQKDSTDLPLQCLPIVPYLPVSS